MDVVKTVHIGDVLTAYSLETKEYQGKMEINATDETFIEVIYIYVVNY